MQVPRIICFTMAVICVVGFFQRDSSGLPDTPETRETLKGIKEALVLTDTTGSPEDLTDIDKALREQLESGVQRLGIHVLTQEEFAKIPGAPCLHLITSVSRIPNDIYVFTVRLEFLQKVRLESRPDTKALAVTWGAKGILGAGPAGKVRTLLKEALSRQLDKFVAAYAQANPRE